MMTPQHFSVENKNEKDKMQKNNHRQMKKILIPILILFLTACTFAGTPKDAKEDKRELISNQKIQECLKLSFKIQREECYLEYVKV